MKYRELKSLFYKDNTEYIQEYQRRFQSDEAVKLSFFIGDKQAFFLQNAEVMTLAYEIAKLDKEIESISYALPGVALKQYSRKCLIDEIVLTNRIEGVHSSRKEIGEVLDVLENQARSRGQQIRFFGLVNKYLKLTSPEEITLTSCQDVRDLYDEVILDEVIFEDASNRPDGVLFRKNSVSVHSETDKVIHTGLMPESRIMEAMEQALSFLNDGSVYGLFRSCLFHYMIEYIHPFYDGNGRLGRLIFSYGISKELCPLVAFRISETIKENVNEYYKAFKVCNDHRNLGDLTPFLLMQLNMVRRAMAELKNSLVERQQTWNKYEAYIGEKDYKKDLRRLYSFLIQAALFSEMGISMRELEANMACSKYTLNKLLTELAPEMTVIKKKGNCRYYSVDLEKLDSSILRESMEKLS